jgi:molybdenum cofactor cytidylyltransferase
MDLSQALRLQSNEVVAFVGAGGKTSAMFRLADELIAQGKRVIVTTTTRLGASQMIEPRLRYVSSPDFSAHVRETLNKHARAFIVGDEVEENKVAGVPREWIDQLAHASAATILYEADGARGLPFKAPAAHEPVVATSTTLLVPVVGASVFAQPLDEAHVHRPARVAELAGARLGEPVTPWMIARVIAHSNGGLKHAPLNARVNVLVNQIETLEQLDRARELARLLLGYPKINAVALGAVQATPPIHETHRRVTAIVLAAGAGTRMSGPIKQLLPWRGKTLIENAIEIATQSQVNETLVVLGAFAEKIRPLVEHSARIVLNRDWQAGHSTSIRAGLNALAPETDAAIFVNADQPFLTSAVLDAIVQRYRETAEAIIAAEYAGRRGSPVLFDRKHFDELMRLTGEQGGRELLAQYPIARVEFADARLGVDVDTLEEYQVIQQA